MGPPTLQGLLPEASPALCRLLDGARGPVEAPIRAEIFGPQRFAQHGRSLGEAHRAERPATRGDTFVPRLQSNIRALREAQRYIDAQVAAGYDVSPAAEWLLDNFHLIEAQIEAVRAGLPRSYFRALPVLQDPPLAGLPRIYGVAWAFVAHTDGAFDEDLLVQFLVAHQETRALALGELWALPTTLRVVLIENLRRLAERVATHKAAREVANLCCDRIGSVDAPALARVHALLALRGVGPEFLAQVALRLQDGAGSGPDPGAAIGIAAAQPATAEMLQWLDTALPDPAGAQRRQRADQAADNLSVSNAVGSLRAIGDADWSDLIARSSALMRVMLGSSPLFAAEHPDTRDQTLHALERLARRSGHSEVAVARALLQRMQAPGSGTPADGQAGSALASHWLAGPGRPALLAALGLDERLPALARRLLLRARLPAYLGTLALGSLGLVAWLMPVAPGALPGPALAWALSGAGWWLTAALALAPASEAVVALINRLIGESARPARLPRLALAEGIPRARRVMVVMPALLSSAPAITALVRRLHLHQLANPEAQAQFALLTDWPDAAGPLQPQDAALLALARREIEALNLGQTRPPEAAAGADTLDGAPRFILLHRARSFCATEQRWIGWERKRGKLEQLIAALAEGTRGPFLDLGEASCMAPQVRSVLTLDADTQLPPGRLRDLVGVAAHPRNQPQMDAGRRVVVAGYGILQPRVESPLPARRQLTRFHQLFAGQCGIDPYSAASSEVYQDLFGEGSFSGKGLLDVAAVHAVLGGRLPEDRVLSHDLLEGALARCATVSDITVVEAAPFQADTAAARLHRWTRGDWQLLPLLLQPRRYPLATINRWKLLDNLRRSLVAPASVLLLLLALHGQGLAPATALALVAAALSAGPLMGTVAGFSPSRDDVALRHFFGHAAAALARMLGGTLWGLQQGLAQAMQAVDAIARTLWRLLVSRRHLLQWTTADAAEAQARARASLPAMLRWHWRTPALALALLAALGLWGTPHPLWSLALCLLWASAPLGAWWVSRPRKARADAQPTAAERLALTTVARDTWRYYERCVSAADRHLPPDNLQSLPQEMLAHRTSPTNIGLYLLSTACAQAFGWIGTPELLARLEATLDTLDTLARHRGHFLNWYDTRSGAPLLPMYVSTVDSGNLSGHLLAVAQACCALARATAGDAAPDGVARAGADETPVDCTTDATTEGASEGTTAETTGRRLHAVAGRCQRLAWAAEFGFLYHPKRHLFHIGLRVAEQTLDAGLYDLLASESRLTSLLAIARGDVPVRHWVALGRPFFASRSLAGLRSWSGSMFEYLMPGLILAEPPGSVLDEAGRVALREQIAWGRAQGLPWGQSESAHAGRDASLAYQYAPQGVPRLALRRTPLDERVVAPYATLMAAPLAPHLACSNLAALEALGARSAMGFIEALDFSPGRQTGAGRCTPVATHMAHHQGMALVALANLLLDGVARRWGMADAHIEAMASLLHERPPRELSKLPPLTATAAPPALQRHAPGLLRDVQPGAGVPEPTQLLSNGHYHVTLRANGAGWSRLGTADLNRWRDDALRDAFGLFLYLQRGARPPQAAPGPWVSLSQHPAPDDAAQYQAQFHADRVVLEALWPDLRVRITVWVSPEDDIEFRQVELHNLGHRPLALRLASAFEVALGEARADEAHPAFANLFVAAAWQPQAQALVFTRRARLADEPALQLAHFLAGGDTATLQPLVQADRARWAGRNRAPSQPLGELLPAPMAAGSADGAPESEANGASVTLDTGLDPVCALGMRVILPARGRQQITFATAASADRATLQAVVDKYRQAGPVQRASLMSATLSGIRLRALRMNRDTFAATQLLSTALLLTLGRARAELRPAASTGAGATEGLSDRRHLWRHGLSGDRPLILVTVSAMHGLGLLRALAQAAHLWSWGGVACDVVVLNGEPASYDMGLQRAIQGLRDRHAADHAAEHPAGPAHPGGATVGWHLLRAGELEEDDRRTLQQLARVRLQADGRPLLHHVLAWAAQHELALDERQRTATVAVPLLRDAAHGAAATPGQGQHRPEGRFDAVAGHFDFEVAPQQRPARPWINVLANPQFGSLVSEAGGGFSWAGNSRLHQITAWSNDALADPPSEWCLLQDCETLQTWSLSPCAWGHAEASYQVRHGQGFSRIAHRHGDLELSAEWCVDARLAVRQLRLRLVNHGPRVRHLRLVGLAEWMMGARRGNRATLGTAMLRQRLPSPPGTAAVGGHGPRTLVTLLCTQHEQADGFGGATAFLSLVPPAGAATPYIDWTCDRRECFDARGRLVLPDHFGQRSGAGPDPCAALSLRLALAPGEAAEPVLLLGHAASPAAAGALALQAAAVPPAARLAEVQAHWNTLLGATTVRTPDALFDALVNRWLLYQTISCRLWAKAGFYQAGGATGFRDQLQDTLALAWAAPQMLRAQILLCASRQFAEGDVQHWWHASGGAGVRTHFSDDRLWLAHALVHHQRCTADASLLDEPVPFLEGEPVPDGADDRYDTPRVGSTQASVYEHAARSIDSSLGVGVHGLPLIGSGDWNDGMNRVGTAGRGESVWLAWFLCRLVADFAPLARARGEHRRAQRWLQAAAGWQAALEGPAWDGHWYRRAFFDDGQPLGAQANAEARIDLIAQAWAVLSGVAAPSRQWQAMAAVDAQLVDEQAGLIRLLTPPLAHAQPSAGYIQAYPPGVRENGGQYTHGAVWALMALAQLHHGAAAGLRGGAGSLATTARVWHWFTLLSPAHRATQPGWGAAYGLEPYVAAGDTCSAAPHTGRGGWSWYTGAAAWLHRAALESILGLQLEARRLRFTPCLPAAWPWAEITLRRDGRALHFMLSRGASPEVALARAPAGALLLPPGQWLDWTAQPHATRFVVPLPDSDD